MKTTLKITLFSAVLVLTTTHTSLAQSAPEGFRDTFLGQFNYSSRVLQLAEAMPAELYDWSPGEGIFSVERVYMHIARYNYYYPASSFGIEPPDGIDLETMEMITGKDTVVEHLRQSIEHVKKHASEMTDETLAEQTTLYGREAQGWAVWLQLLAHMNEHVGQSIAYARMNSVKPPWAQ